MHTLIRFGEPFTIAFTRITFGFQARLERLCEWETFIPKATSLPQISHFAKFVHLLYKGCQKATCLMVADFEFKCKLFSSFHSLPVSKGKHRFGNHEFACFFKNEVL